jgi:hypothetical protein
MAIKSQVDFDINTVGEISSKEYVGKFVAKTKLSMMEIIKEDEIYRTTLGIDPVGASRAACDLAHAIAYLQIRIIKSPAWWEDMGHGRFVEDLNLLIDINNQCREAIDKEYASIIEAGKKAKEEVKKSIENV